MPLFYFQCKNPECSRQHKTFFKLSAPGKLSNVVCEECQVTATRTPKSPSSMTVEVVDDGWNAKRIERIPEAKRFFREREIENDRKRKEESTIIPISPELEEALDEEALDNYGKKY